MRAQKVAVVKQLLTEGLEFEGREGWDALNEKVCGKKGNEEKRGDIERSHHATEGDTHTSRTHVEPVSVLELVEHTLE